MKKLLKNLYFWAGIIFIIGILIMLFAKPCYVSTCPSGVFCDFGPEYEIDYNCLLMKFIPIIISFLLFIIAIIKTVIDYYLKSKIKK